MSMWVWVCEYHHNRNTENSQHWNKFPWALLQLVPSLQLSPGKHSSFCNIVLPYLEYSRCLYSLQLSYVTHMITISSLFLQSIHVFVFKMHISQATHSWILLLYSVYQSLPFDWSVLSLFTFFITDTVWLRLFSLFSVCFLSFLIVFLFLDFFYVKQKVLLHHLFHLLAYAFFFFFFCLFLCCSRY